LKTKALALFAFVIGAVVLSSGTVVATPGSGFGATTVSKGTLAGPVKLEGLGLKLSTKATTDMVIQQINIDPGAQSGWHQHPAAHHGARGKRVQNRPRPELRHAGGSSGAGAPHRRAGSRLQRDGIDRSLAHDCAPLRAGLF
jgi:hypothetical protein